MSLPAITRFAPSPTGALHLGNVRTALFSYLWARNSGGRFILRIEDTDGERSQARFRDDLMAQLRWLGLEWDEGPDIGGPATPYCQAERGAYYQELFIRLETQGLAYPCYCTPAELELSRKLQRMAGKPPRYAGTCRHLSAVERGQHEARGLRPSLRFAVPPEVIEFVDIVHGPQRYDAGDIGDFIIRREDGTSAFFFCNAVDDAVMGITHVLRGDDHLTNTPRQLMILDALGLRRPGYGHVGLLVGTDGAPLSKRHGSTSVHDFRERGFLSIAILNQLFRLGHASDIDGWLPKSDMPKHFRPEHLGRAPARFEDAQLMHWQKESLQHLSVPQFTDWLGQGMGDHDSTIVDLLRPNILLPTDLAPWLTVLRGTLPLFGPNEQQIINKAGSKFFQAAVGALVESNGDLKILIKILKELTGAKGPDLFMPLRVALTAQTHGPELASLLKLMPLNIALTRLKLHAQNI